MIKIDDRSQKILRLIKEKGIISRADISRFLRIRSATTIEIIKKLEKERIIKKAGWGESTGGRLPFSLLSRNSLILLLEFISVILISL